MFGKKPKKSQSKSAKGCAVKNTHSKMEASTDMGCRNSTSGAENKAIKNSTHAEAKGCATRASK